MDERSGGAPLSNLPYNFMTIRTDAIYYYYIFIDLSPVLIFDWHEKFQRVLELLFSFFKNVKALAFCLSKIAKQFFGN